MSIQKEFQRHKKLGLGGIMLLVLVLLVTACGVPKTESGTQGTSTAESNTTNGKTDNLNLKGKRVALIMEFNTGTFSQQYVQGVEEEVKKFGGTLTKFVADNDKAKMASLLDSAINQQFDVILTDHGDALLETGLKKAISRNIPVIVFDAAINVPGAVVLSQDDQSMAELTLEQMKKDIGGKGNIVKVWVAGFAPMERRQVAYGAFLKSNPDIKEIATFGSAQNPALDTQAKMEAVLKQYPKGEITAVWAAWDEFAKGAARAIQQAGRTEIKVYGIDMSDEDLQMIQDPKNPWVASAAVDPTDIGRVQVRYAYQKLHGDNPEEKVVLKAVYVQREALPDKQISTSELSQYVKGWGQSEQGYKDWMKEYETSK
ncbi:simple sugar transport system substrate-binding protein [Paenibacillus polymyxa]|uniref:sugar ABC transporter substrate-binding protein n=1 Tax=Paenibacillus polymyxa TaxID=1406 RepID=UPI002790611D|nr:sugar ABC transporter substrate-binding protein [Paenibacillus polymyxa]MDQ0046213.1 simple sugar transport system substrate-binding protein [Paenibacillus polymyxa]